MKTSTIMDKDQSHMTERSWFEDHMTTSTIMDKDQSHMTESILDLTLGIIYLLTGEGYAVVKKTSAEYMMSDNHQREIKRPNTFPSSVFMTPENNKKILEVIQKITKLLTGEVSIRCQDVTVYFSMEEWEYLERHKDLYKDVMMENHHTLTSPDETSNEDPPESPRPLLSQDSKPEDQEIPQHQHEEEMSIKSEVKKEEDISVKVYQNTRKRNGMKGNVKEEKPSLVFSTESDITQSSPKVNPILHKTHHRPQQLETSMNPPDPEEPSDQSHTDSPSRSHSLQKSAKPSNFKQSSIRNEETHTGEGSLSCLGCGKSFKTNSELRVHLRSHTSVTFSCAECGKTFTEESKLVLHQKVHTGKHPFLCSECGKFFTTKQVLIRHQRSHTGVRPYLCSECGKCFAEKHVLLRHQTIHTGQGLYSCSECGKSFMKKEELSIHQRIHTGERPFTCSECGKSFTVKGSLLRHQRGHIAQLPSSS